MTGSMWIDADAVRASAPAFRSLGDRLEDVFTTLRGRLEAEGECWGTDSYGTAFAEKYVEPRDGAMKFFPEMVKALRGVGDGLVQMADNSDKAEDANKQKFTT